MTTLSALAARRRFELGVNPKLGVSFEFFPPRTPEMEQDLWHAISRLAPVGPTFVSVTYGAGGSTRERAHSTIERIIAETDLVPAAHLPRVGATRGGGPAGGGRLRRAGGRPTRGLRRQP